MTVAPDSHQISLLPPDAASLLHLVRENLRLLAKLAGRYEVGRLNATIDGLTIRRPADVAEYLSAELADLAQEQLRVVLLDSSNKVIATSLVYQGSLNSTVIPLGDCFREAVSLAGASASRAGRAMG